MAKPNSSTDLQRSRIFWLQREHFDVGSPTGIWPERFHFELRTAFDVVAAPG